MQGKLVERKSVDWWSVLFIMSATVTNVTRDTSASPEIYGIYLYCPSPCPRFFSKIPRHENLLRRIAGSTSQVYWYKCLPESQTNPKFFMGGIFLGKQSFCFHSRWMGVQVTAECVTKHCKFKLR